MNTRTIKFLGQGYGAAPSAGTATWSGTSIFSGTIPSIDAPRPGPSDPSSLVIFTHEIPMNLSGNVAMTFQVTAETCLIGQILANYANVANTVGNVTTYSSSGPDEYLPIHLGKIDGVGDVRVSVSIDGIPQTPERTPTTMGTWGYFIAAGSTLECQVMVTEGLDTTP